MSISGRLMSGKAPDARFEGYLNQSWNKGQGVQRVGYCRLELLPNGKDCDIGYAPTAGSCEGVGDPDTCTVAVLDATTASAVSDPGCLSQG